ncbi:hypothetical protein M405DRAFT_841656 [Rhizopogon salebrosus TDB-379]|nr:hypothetical protein M405DRAFT_841656 [Rhizopogon salebrosus TDB-379]
MACMSPWYSLGIPRVDAAPILFATLTTKTTSPNSDGRCLMMRKPGHVWEYLGSDDVRTIESNVEMAFLDSEAIVALRLPAASMTWRKARLVVRVRGHSSLGFAVQALGWSSSSSVFVRSPASPSFGNSVTFFIGGGRAIRK